ncbi:MAG TPA: tetratricopeptide repeat protein [Gemmatimonadales bacterium]|nr:tetratricopeptide repeat protein [Gemmatimonadales bacterium]
MRILGLVAGCVLAAAAGAPAQLAIQQPTHKLLVLPLAVKNPADSAVSVAVMDAARARLAQLAKYKVLVIPKTKLCEALKASDFPCDVLLDDSQAQLLARFLNVNAYTTGTLERSGGTLRANVRVRDIGGSGFAAQFSVSGGNPGTPQALGEAIAQRLNNIVRAGEHARECNDQRQKSQFAKALDAARKALAIEPNLAAAHICVATVYEAQRLSPDSQLAAYQRAAAADTLNATAWSNIARLYQQKGDTLKAIDAFVHQLQGEPQNMALRLGIAELLRQQKQYQRAVAIIDEGLARNPSDQKLLDLKARVCIEGELWRCVLDGFVAQARADTTKLADSGLVKAAIGAAQQVADTQQLVFFAHAAARHFPKSPPFWEALGAAFELKGERDSSVWAYTQAFVLDPNRHNTALLIAKAIVDGAAYDTTQASKLKADTAALRRFRNAFADKLDTARAYVTKALASPDPNVRLSAAVILLTGGSKLAQAGAYERAYPWLEQTLQLVTPATPSDTVGPRQQIRVQASFWYGISSVASLSAPYSEMIKSKSCAEAKAINERIARTKEALILGARVHPPTANTMLQNVAKFEAIMPQVKKQFKCTNF